MINSVEQSQEKCLIPELRFPEFEGDWQKSTLKKSYSIITGSTPPTSDKSNYGEDYLFVSPADLGKEKFVTNTKTMLSKKGFDKSRSVEKGAVFFVCIGSTIGKVGQAHKESCTNQQINSLQARNNHFNDFGYYLLEKNGPKIKLLAGVQAVPQLNKTDFSNLKFYFPNFKEQQKIANFLSAIDQRITLLKEKKAALEDYKKGLMQKIFSQEVRFTDDEGNAFPDWEEKKVGDFTKVIRGKGLSKSAISEEGNYPCILYGELFTKYKEVINSIISATNKEDGVLSKAGDILMPTSDVTPKGLAKASALMIDGVKLGGDMNILRPLKNISSIFLSYLLNHSQKGIIRLVTGTTVKHIYASDIKGLKLNMPTSFKEQQKIANFLSGIDQKINAMVKQIADSELFKKGLLQRMFV